jgi:hypothetical protein
MFSADFLCGTGMGAGAGEGGVYAGSSAADLPDFESKRLPSTPSAMPPINANTHGHFGDEAVGWVTVESETGTPPAPGWAEATGALATVNNNSSPHPASWLANWLRVMKHLGKLIQGVFERQEE